MPSQSILVQMTIDSIGTMNEPCEALVKQELSTWPSNGLWFVSKRTFVPGTHEIDRLALSSEYIAC